MSRIFITGIAGFLGSHLADHFIARGDEVSGIDNLLGGYRDNVPAAATWAMVDCNDFAQVRSMIRDVDVVYHLAAAPYEGLSVFSPHLVTQNLVTAATGVFSAAIAEGVKRIVFASSMARYGSQSAPFTEDMAPRPQDPYGIGKVCAEDLLRNLCTLHGIEHVICVPHNIIGPRQRYCDPFRNVAAIFINRMLQGQQPYIYGHGSQIRCFSFVSDVVEPLARMATAPVAEQIINVGPDRGAVTILGLAELIAGMLSFRLDPIFVPARPAEVVHATCWADKARELLGYEPRTSLEEGLQQMIAWIKKRGPRPFEYHLPIEITEGAPKTWTEKLFND